MDLTYVDEKSLKSLEDYAVFLVTSMLTFKTLQNFQVRAIEIGIIKEDMNERANTMIWDLRRLLKLYKDQVEAVLELLPDDFNATEIIEALQKKEITKARAMSRKPRVKKCAT